MVLAICRAAKKAWFRTIQEVYCWGERIPRWLCKLKPSIAEQAEKRLGLQSVPSAWLVALWNLTELQRGLTSGQRFVWKSRLEDLPSLYLSSSTCVVLGSGTRPQSSDGCVFFVTRFVVAKSYNLNRVCVDSFAKWFLVSHMWAYCFFTLTLDHKSDILLVQRVYFYFFVVVASYKKPFVTSVIKVCWIKW